MKKQLLTLLLSLIALSSVSYGEELNSLFGITLYDNAEKYVSSNYIDSNIYKNPETIEGYFDLEITDKIKVKSPYVSEYWITIDSDNIIHSVFGAHFLNNLDRCLEVQEDLLSNLEEKYQVDFEYMGNSYPGFKIYRYQFYDSSNNHFALQCNDDYEYGDVIRQIYIETEKLLDSIDEFYDSGL